jgi:hypothetical protein
MLIENKTTRRTVEATCLNWLPIRRKRVAPYGRYLTTFQLVDCRQTWGEDRVYFHDDSGQLTRLPRQWTDVVPDDPTVVVGAGRVHFRYHDLCRLADLLTRLDARLLGERADQEC